MIYKIEKLCINFYSSDVAKEHGEEFNFVPFYVISDKIKIYLTTSVCEKLIDKKIIKKNGYLKLSQFAILGTCIDGYLSIICSEAEYLAKNVI